MISATNDTEISELVRLQFFYIISLVNCTRLMYNLQTPAGHG